MVASKKLDAKAKGITVLKAKKGEDVVVSNNGKRSEIPTKEITAEHKAFDIGEKTVEKYCNFISKAKTVVVNGPPGRYEEPEFSYGTRRILEAIASSDAFSLAGGGDTVSAIEAFGIDRKKFSYISLGGHALLDYLTGKKLPGVEVLK